MLDDSVFIVPPGELMGGTGGTAPDAIVPAEDLHEQQLTIERRCFEDAANRYHLNNREAVSSGRSAETTVGRSILSNCCIALENEILAWKERVGTGQPEVHADAYDFMELIPSRKISFIFLKHLMNGVAEDRRLTSALSKIGSAIEDEALCEAVRRNDLKLYNELVQNARRMNKREAKRNTFLHARHSSLQWDVWTRAEKIRVAAACLSLFQRVAPGLVEVVGERTTRAQGTKTINYLRPTKALLSQILDKQFERHPMWLGPIFEPMVVPPRDWSSPHDGGYLSERSINAAPMIRSRLDQREITGARMAEEFPQSPSEAPIVYAALNEAQATPWRVNRRVLDVMLAAWKGRMEFPGIPRSEAEPAPEADRFDLSTDDGAYRFRKAKKLWYDEERHRQCERMTFELMFRQIRRYSAFDKIYFPMSYDFRGRMYPIPTVNFQGRDWCKAVFERGEPRPLGQDGETWLAIHLANVGDFDKVSKRPLGERVLWVQENYQKILDVARDPYVNRWWMEADEPWQFLAACFAYRDVFEGGFNTAVSLNVHFDATCSGIQHFSALFKDEVGGRAVNLMATDGAQDIYSEVATVLEELVRADLTSNERITAGKSHVTGEARQVPVSMLAQQWLEFGITRAVCKRPTMTYGYGSRLYGFKNQIYDDIIKPAREAAKRGTGRNFPFTHPGWDAACYLGERMVTAVERVIVKAGEAMSWLQEVATIVGNHDRSEPLSWTTPDGFRVINGYPETSVRRVKTTIDGNTYRLQIHEPIEDRLSVSKTRNAIAPNLVHSLDATHLRLVLVRAAEEGITGLSVVHDSFGCHPADAGRVFQIIRETFVELYGDPERDIIGDFIRDVVPCDSLEIPDPPTSGSLDISEVIKSDYAFS